MYTPTAVYFDPSFSVSGTFSGIDADRDGTIARAELTELTLGGIDWTTCGNGPYVQCDIIRFSYSASDGLEVYTRQVWIEDIPWSDASTVHTTIYDTTALISYEAHGENVDELYAYGFTEETLTNVTLISAVPEPQTYALFGAGMLLLGAAARRNQRAPHVRSNPALQSDS